MTPTDRQARPAVTEIKNAYDHLFTSSIGIGKIKDAALGGRLFSPSSEDGMSGVAGRSLAWKLFLIPSEPLQTDTNAPAVPPLKPLRRSREKFRELLLDRMRAPDGSYEDGVIVPGTGKAPPRFKDASVNLDRNNPLSLHDENPWTEWFASMELRKTILQDVERTFPDMDYFRDREVQTQLTNILFVYSVTHPDIGYRQGMHELLAPLYYAVDYDSIPEDAYDIHDPTLKEFTSRLWVSADAWALFEAVMHGAGRWYEWKEGKTSYEKSPFAAHVQVNMSSDNSMKAYVAPIIEACNRVQSVYLKSVDPELWRHMQGAGIEPQIYGIRWLRLLFTRELPMHDAMVLWDALFACDPSLDLAQWVCVAMLIRIRNHLIPSDYSGQLTCLLRYPQVPRSDTASIHPSSLLIRQALTLQMSPNPATGVSIVQENRNVLDIPMEAPQRDPSPPRRKPKTGERGQFASEAGLSGRLSVHSNQKSHGHGRQGSTPIGLPEIIAKGLLDRGESLGINRTVMNAVSELKKSIPELANSLARLPQSPQASFADYPLVDERPPEERPPWEPRTRFEMEKDIADLRALQKRLGESVGWIVDTLLLDEGEGTDEQRAKSIKNRKREALESLAYVRDILKGTVQPSDVEEDRLVSEEELARRREAALKKQSESNSESPQDETVVRALMPPPPAASAPAPHQSGPNARQSFPRHKGGPFPATSPATPSASFSTKPPLQTSRHSAAPSPAPTTAILTPNEDSLPLAPWNYTRSNFSARGHSPIVTLPRPPPKTSTSLRPNIPSASSFHGISVTDAPGTTASRHQGTRDRDKGVQNDPLGALS
ncbi:hypothetical protein K474DRAFT_1650559 [Panus rudis PR-1116 ss-1]|nr:hypothetical protein K474DRAFT_1650559 [Panus rudis PR-1116 ss-1]